MYIYLSHICIVRIEEAIQQKEFTTPKEKAIVNLLYTHCWLSIKQMQAIKKFGITVQQFNILRILRGQYPNPASVKLLTARMLDKSSNASRLVDKLVVKKLVERQICAGDRRQVEVVISETGLQLLENAAISLQVAMNPIPLDPNECLMLSDLLDKMRSSD